MRLVYLLSFIIYCNLLTAQNSVDTIYYDKNWQGVNHKAFADFYRVALFPEDTIQKQQFRDFYISGELQGSGFFISIDKLDESKSVLEGEHIQYYKNGQIESKVNYTKGIRNGEFYEYTENGLVLRAGNFFDGKLSGLYTEFFDDDSYSQVEYLNGFPKYDYYIKGNSNNQFQKIRFSDNTPIWESPTISEREVKYQDGVAWQYYEKNGLMVALTNTKVKDYGKWHRVDIIISNHTMAPIEFEPTNNIQAYSITNKETVDILRVYSSEDYLKKVKRAQVWEAVAVGLSEGIVMADAGYTTSTRSSHNTYSKTTTYNGLAAYQAQILSQQRLTNFADAQWDERYFKKLGYLKRNTISPGETLQGYVLIKRMSGKFVHIEMTLNDAKYIYEWDF